MKKPSTAKKKPAGKRVGAAAAREDPYLVQVHAAWDVLTKAYRDFSERGPLIAVFDIEEGRVYVYPFDAFRAELSPASQASLDEQWLDAQDRGEQVVFVRDNAARKLVSYSLRIA
jgi:hypothetical protein